MADFQDVVALMNESGTPMEGLDFEVSAASEIVVERFGNKPFCVVRGWSILDVEGISMPMLYANYVITDSKGRFRSGDWVRSSPAIAPPRQGFFETRSTVYVLLGPGRAKKTRPDIVLALRGCRWLASETRRQRPEDAKIPLESSGDAVCVGAD